MSNLLGSEADRFGCTNETCPIHEASRNARPKAIVGNTKLAVQRGNGGYAGWVIVSVHGLKTYLDLAYRRLLDVLHEMPRIARNLGLEGSQLPDFTTVYARIQDLKMPIRRRLLQLSAQLHDTGEIQDIHCSMNQPHDTQIAWQLLTYNLAKLNVLTADKGYDWELLRHILRSEGVKPATK